MLCIYGVRYVEPGKILSYLKLIEDSLLFFYFTSIIHNGQFGCTVEVV